MRKELINNIIKPFFKNELYSNKGIYFFKDYGFIQVVTEIQSQRYYKEENSENFRINFELYCNEFENIYGLKKIFGGFSVHEKSSWIEINPNVDLEKKGQWLLSELENAILEINKRIKIDNLIEIWGEDETDIRLIFLLKKNEPEKYKELKTKLQAKLIKIKTELIDLEKQKENMTKVKSLNNDCLLDGLKMKINRKKSESEKIEKLINNDCQ